MFFLFYFFLFTCNSDNLFHKLLESLQNCNHFLNSIKSDSILLNFYHKKTDPAIYRDPAISSPTFPNLPKILNHLMKTELTNENLFKFSVYIASVPSYKLFIPVVRKNTDDLVHSLKKLMYKEFNCCFNLKERRYVPPDVLIVRVDTNLNFSKHINFGYKKFELLSFLVETRDKKCAKRKYSCVFVNENEIITVEKKLVKYFLIYSSVD